MRETCLKPIDGFYELGTVTDTQDGAYIFQDNGASILGVAHLDSVLDLDHFHVMNIRDSDYVFNAQLDDRLGAYTMLDLLPQLGIKFDLLLTEGEETGFSTAAHFTTDKPYNWIFSFDRRGVGVVMYQYESKDWVKAFREHKFEVQQGSFSDIAFMDTLGVKAVNIGTGYHGEHSDFCYASMDELNQQIKKFKSFYEANKDIKYSHAYKPKRFGGFGIPSFINGQRDNIAYSRGTVVKEYDGIMCELCHNETGTEQLEEALWLCKRCASMAQYCTHCKGLFYDYELLDGICDDCAMDLD